MSWANFSAKCPGLKKKTKNLSKFEEEKKKKKNYRSVFGTKSREKQ